MRFSPFASMLAIVLAVAPRASTAIESQARGTAESLPATVVEVFRCGKWIERGRHGHHRLILAEVSGGAGTEVYVQRIVESLEASNQVLRVLSTTPIVELNDDHGQYQVSAAKCTAGNAVELRASFEHDPDDAERRIRLVLLPGGTYRIGNVVVPAARRRP